MPRRRDTRTVALLVVTLVAVTRPLASAPGFPRYRLTELGCLLGHNVAVPTGINNRGQVVGYSYRHVPPGHFNSLLSSPFLWEKGRIRRLDTLGGEFGHALAINNHGDIVGSAEDPQETRPVIWRRASGYRPEPLSTAPGAAMCIDDAGAIAGVLEVERRPRRSAAEEEPLLPELREESGRDPHPVIWRRGTVTRLGAPAGENVRFTGLAPAGDPVGHTYRTTMMISYEERAYRWRSSGKPEALRTLGGEQAVAEAVTAHGLIVGWSEDRAGHRHATLWRDGNPQALPAAYTEAGDEYAHSAAHGINRKGAIVGESGGACLWLGGRPRLLSTRTRRLGTWSLWDAAAINDRGWIVGTGRARPGSITDAFLLTPL